MESSLGFATYYQRVKVVEVHSEQELIDNVAHNVSLSIQEDFDITQRIKITEEITILGNGHKLTMQEPGSIYFQNTQNIFVLDLTLEGQGSDWDNNLDLMTFDNVQNVVIKNCTFSDGADECVGFKNGCDDISIMETLFTYTKPPKTVRVVDHNFALLIGKNADDKPVSGKHHVCLDNVSFIGDIRRCPRVRNAYVFMNRCTFNTTSLYTVGPENSELVFVDCKFINRDVHHPQFIHKFGDYKCIIVEKGQVVYKNPKFSQFNKPEFYEKYSDSRVW